MTLDEFWLTLEGLNPETAVEELEARLQKLPDNELEDFEAHFLHIHRRAYDWLLWAAAYLINGGCSDDGFTDFRYGLISRGRAFFESVLADPDSLADRLIDNDFIPNEEFGYVAAKVFEEKTGEPIPTPELPPVGAPQGEDWDFDNADLCSEKLPKIWKRYGDA